MNANVGGVVPLSTVDWHGKSAAVIFLNGCPFRCGYCHNYDLLEKSNPTDLELVKKRVAESKPFISAVVFLGGEPLMQGEAVSEIAEFAKEQGLQIGIHTNGFYPKTVAALIENKLADKFFVDIKASFDKSYEKTVGIQSNAVISNIQKSIQIIDESPAELEIKTTVFPEIVGSKSDIDNISKWMNKNIKNKSKLTYILQQGKGGNSKDPAFQKMSFLSPEEMDILANAALENLDGGIVFTQTDEDGRVEKKKQNG